MFLQTKSSATFLISIFTLNFFSFYKNEELGIEPVSFHFGKYDLTRRTVDNFFRV